MNNLEKKQPERQEKTKMNLAQWKSGQPMRKVATRVQSQFNGGKNSVSTNGFGTSGYLHTKK